MLIKFLRISFSRLRQAPIHRPGGCYETSHFRGTRDRGGQVPSLLDAYSQVRWSGRRPAQHALDLSHQFAQVEWLWQVVIGPISRPMMRSAVSPRPLRIMIRPENSHATSERGSVRPRRAAEIEDDEIDQVLGYHPAHRRPVMSRRYPVALAGKIVPDEFA